MDQYGDLAFGRAFFYNVEFLTVYSVDCHQTLSSCTVIKLIASQLLCFLWAESLLLLLNFISNLCALNDKFVTI